MTRGRLAAASVPSIPRRRAVESFGTAAECIGPVGPGMSVFALTRGQFTMLEALLAVLAGAGPSVVSVWTWSLYGYTDGAFERLVRDPNITGATLVLDPDSQGRALERCAASLGVWRARFGPESIRGSVAHAKIATVSSASGLRIVLRGSLVLAPKARIDQFDVTEGCAAFDAVRALESTFPILPAVASPSRRKGVGFGPAQLSLLSGLKVWRR